MRYRLKGDPSFVVEGPDNLMIQVHCGGHSWEPMSLEKFTWLYEPAPAFYKAEVRYGKHTLPCYTDGVTPFFERDTILFILAAEAPAAFDDVWRVEFWEETKEVVHFHHGYAHFREPGRRLTIAGQQIHVWDLDGWGWEVPVRVWD